MRVAETIAYCRIPIGAFIDIGAGTGWLLDALAVLLPEAIDRFHAVELYPPPLPHRTANPNYVIGTLADTAAHLRCRRLHRGDRASHAGYAAHAGGAACRGIAAGSLYLFNSGQPDFVEHEDPGYLDPHGRGHIVSYSLAGAASIFAPAGLQRHRAARPRLGVPGRVRHRAAGR